ncbi:hypothetical protein [Bacteroides cellulosilyticus]|uniref:hypothetical protein n=1 Tax=Bacteroides cellulosilyticus TaxID=246787 RepID=UPI00321ABBD7
MKTIKSFLILVALILGSLAGNSVYAQYSPGVQLPGLSGPADYDWQRGDKGFLRYVGNSSSTPMDRRSYSIITGWPSEERFRVSANGTTSIIGASDGKPALNFYNAWLGYLGSIGFPGDEMTISGNNGIRINPSKQNKIFLTADQTSVFNPLHLSLKGYYANEGVTFKLIRNQDPSMVSSMTGKRLRIGSKSGIGFWGNGNAGVDDTPTLEVKADGSVSVSNAITMKIGRNSAPTIQGATSGKWLRVGGDNGVALWGNGNMGEEDSPHVLVKENSLTVGQVASPDYALNVGGSIYMEKSGVKTFFGRDTDDDDAWIGTKSNHGLYLSANGKSCMYIDAANRNAYIGLIDTFIAQIRQELKTKYKLFVAKGVLSEDYGISPKSSWSDFVFDESYTLKSISEVEEFISENNHLPDVPSAKQVAEEGYSQHEMNKILLQKIEELTLYTIKQQKEIETLRGELDSIKK